MNFLFTLCSCCIFSLCVQAQHTNTSLNDAREIKKRILLAGLPEENKHFLSQLAEENPEYTVAYKTDIEGQREAFRKVITSQWKFNDSIVFVSLKEAKSLMKASPAKYALLKIDEQIQDKVYVKGYDRIAQVTGWELRGEDFAYNYYKRYSVGMLGITSLVIDLPKTAIKVYLPKVSPSEGDFANALHQMEYILSSVLKSELSSSNSLYRKPGVLPDHLKDKTLLLDMAEIDRFSENVGMIYPYPIKFVDYTTIEKALCSKDSSIVLVQCTRVDATNSVFYLNNAGDGTIYAQFTEPTFNYGEIDGAHYTIQVFYPKIKMVHMKQLCGVK